MFIGSNARPTGQPFSRFRSRSSNVSGADILRSSPWRRLPHHLGEGRVPGVIHMAHHGQRASPGVCQQPPRQPGDERLGGDAGIFGLAQGRGGGRNRSGRGCPCRSRQKRRRSCPRRWHWLPGHRPGNSTPRGSGHRPAASTRSGRATRRTPACPAVPAGWRDRTWGSPRRGTR